jgi:hypothetical protein
MTYLLFMIGLITVVWGLPALVFLFVLKMSFSQSMLFGFLSGSLVLGALEMLGLFSKGVWRLAKKSKKPKQ